MFSPTRIWIVLGVLYAGFTGWYTSFGGALTSDEIDKYMEVFSARATDPAGLARWKHFMETDTGDDFVMVNVIDMRDTPLQVDGVEPGETSGEVLAKYTRPFLGRAFRSAAHPVFMGSAASNALDLWGIEGAERWTTGGLVRYRSRRDLLEQASALRDSNIHSFKIAAMSKTIAFPVDPFFQLGDPRLVLGLVFLVIGLSVHLRSALRRASAS
jgi:hypothetical protein